MTVTSNTIGANFTTQHRLRHSSDVVPLRPDHVQALNTSHSTRAPGRAPKDRPSPRSGTVTSLAVQDTTGAKHSARIGGDPTTPREEHSRSSADVETRRASPCQPSGHLRVLAGTAGPLARLNSVSAMLGVAWERT
jgi:hypothetical protein